MSDPVVLLKTIWRPDPELVARVIEVTNKIAAKANKAGNIAPLPEEDDHE